MRDRLARVAYDAYRNHTGGISLISKLPIPEWEKLNSDIQEAWKAAAAAVVLDSLGAK